MTVTQAPLKRRPRPEGGRPPPPVWPGGGSASPSRPGWRWLAQVALVVRFEKGEELYGDDSRADAMFAIITGMVKIHKVLPDGKRPILAFLFAGDLLGVTDQTTHAVAASAGSAVTAYRYPSVLLERSLHQDAFLEFNLLIRQTLCREVREAREHALILRRLDAAGRLAGFLSRLLARAQGMGEGDWDLYLPMDRSDIAAYIGTSPEAVSRAFRRLADDGVVRFRDRRHVRITNPDGLAALAAGKTPR